MKDLVLLVAGSALGICGSMIATILVGPIADRITGFRSRKWLSQRLPIFWQDSALCADWKQTWSVTENGEERPHSSNIRIYKFLNLIACEFTYEGKNGQIVDAQIVALIDNGRFITGRWFNANDPSGYHGALQLRRSGDSQRFEGAWIGLSDTSGIKSGSWLWERNPHSLSMQ